MSGAPDVREIRGHAGARMAIGVPLLILGACMAASPWLGAEWRNKRGHPTPPGTILLIGSLMATAGALVAGIRTGVVLDRGGGTVTSWWGLGAWTRRRERAMADFARVALVRELRRHKNSHYTVFPLRLEGRGDPLLVRDWADARAARREAEIVAKHLRLPLHDASGGAAEADIPCDRLDESVAARAKRTGQRPPRPLPPTRTTLQARCEGAQAVCELPARGPWSAPGLVSLGTAALALLGFAQCALPALAEVFPQAAHGDPGAAVAVAVVLALVLGPFALVGIPALRAMTARDRVTVSREGVRLERVDALGARGWEMDGNEIEDVVVGPPDAGGVPGRFAGARVVCVRSDAATLHLGGGLAERDREWLRDCLLHYLARG